MNPTAKQTEKSVRVIVGLGNPGKKYAQTRHNIGHWVIDALVADVGSKGKLKKKGNFEGVSISRNDCEVFFAKPAVYMNHSGIAVRELLEYFQIKPNLCLVVMDDIYLPVGKIRFRNSGSSGGHNGLQSVIDEIGTSDFPRLKVGIGHHGDKGEILTDYVLSCFPKEDVEPVQKAVEDAREACLAWLDKGPEVVMRRFN